MLLSPLSELHPLEVAIVASPEFRRLEKVGQLEIGPLVESFGLQDPSGTLKRSRAQHCYEARNLADWFSDSMQLSERDALLLRTVMLVHDLQQPGLFSHLGERLMRRHGDFDHDVDTISALKQPHSEIAGLIDLLGASVGISTQDVISVLEEDTTRTHRLGFLAREIVDRLAYLLADIGGTGLKSAIKIELEMAALQLVKRGLQIDPAGQIWVREQPKDTDNPLVVLLRARNVFYEQYNLHPAALLFESLMALQFDHLIDSQVLRPNDLARMTDLEALELFRSKGLPNLPLPELDQGKVGSLNLGQHYRTLRHCSFEAIAPASYEFFAQNGSTLSPGAKAELQAKLNEISPEPGSVLVCQSRDYSKSTRIPVQHNSGTQSSENVAFNVAPKNRVFFVVYRVGLPEGVRTALIQEVDRFLGKHLKQGKQAERTEILNQIRHPQYFLELDHGIPAARNGSRNYGHKPQ